MGATYPKDIKSAQNIYSYVIMGLSPVRGIGVNKFIEAGIL